MTDTVPTARISMDDIGAAIGKLEALRAELAPGEWAVMEGLLRAARVRETCPVQYNPYLPGVHSDPHPHYARLREENPLHRSESTGAWVMSRYADVMAAFHDRRLSSKANVEGLMADVAPREREQVAAVCRFISTTVNQTDPPEHARQRRILARALAPSLIAGKQAWLGRAVDELIDRVVDRGEMDLVRDFAEPLPPMVSTDLLGIPCADRPQVNEWTGAVMQTFSEGFSGSASMERGAVALPHLIAYLAPLVAERRFQPSNDAISAMLSGDDASDDEVVKLSVQFLMGIHETIRHMLSVGMLALLREPEQWRRIREEPALIPLAVEELLRYDTIAPYLKRTAVERVDMGEVTIHAGDLVMLLLPSANRDPARFSEPDRLDIGRRPNPHLAFGAGIHSCPGASLTRTVGAVAIDRLLHRLPDLRLAGSGLVWREESNIRGLTSMPVAFTPRRTVAEDTGLVG